MVSLSDLDKRCGPLRCRSSLACLLTLCMLQKGKPGVLIGFMDAAAARTMLTVPDTCTVVAINSRGALPLMQDPDSIHLRKLSVAEMFLCANAVPNRPAVKLMPDAAEARCAHDVRHLQLLLTLA